MGDYPTAQELRKLKNLATPFLENQTRQDFLDFLESIWWAADWGFKVTGKNVVRLELHTGGWSGNEEIIDTLHKTFFWSMYWRSSRTGGHYYFKIPLISRGREREE